jgi:hypothetical protein
MLNRRPLFTVFLHGLVYNAHFTDIRFLSIFSSLNSNFKKLILYGTITVHSYPVIPYPVPGIPFVLPITHNFVAQFQL